MLTLRSTVLLVAAALAPAQSMTVVSPLGTAAVEGNSNNTLWASAGSRRYQQIHSDLKGTPHLFTKLAWRQEGTATVYTGTRNIDLELYMGNSVDWNSASFVFAANYAGTPSLVVPRMIWVAGPVNPGTPAPFDAALPLGTPFFHSGVSSIAWEAVIYSSSASGTWPVTFDADAGTITTAATATTTGPGCTVAGRTGPMTMDVQAADCSGSLAFGAWVDLGPGLAPTVLYLGTSNPNLAVPGLCGNVYTNLALALPMSNLTGTGFNGQMQTATVRAVAGANVWMLPNTLPGALIYAQAHSLDASSTLPIPIANSDGKSFVVPSVNASRVDMVTRVTNNQGGTLGTEGIFFARNSVGYGIVTQFTY